ncbi:MAG: transposase [Bacteroidia bacterium]
MKFEPGKLYHVYNRGNNKQPIFLDRENYLYFLKKVRKHILPHADILNYCLMPNHFHFLIKVKDDYDPTKKSQNNEPLVKLIATLLSSYSKAFNNRFNKVGNLFQQKTQSIDILEFKNIHSDYEKTCFHYIHQNPLKAGLVKRMEDWEFSSFKDYIGLRNGTLCNQKLALSILGLPLTKDEFYKLSYEVINDTWFE